MKKIVAVNGSPRTEWNTSLIVREAARGAEEAGAEVEVIDLYKLDKFTGCVSCFGCKLNGGRCVCSDGLKPVLDKIREADGVIMGSPNYLTDVSAVFRAFFERLVFQAITYKKEKRSYNERLIPAVFIMTSNTGKETYTPDTLNGQMVARYENFFNTFVGPTKTLICGNTLQVNNYDIYNWTNFDPEAKKASRAKQFPKDLAEAYELGRQLAAE